ncbi:hypothetical protein E2C01_020276 [Portunus trituberculatus]|uniref:Helix-turn-helix domain-containing protein n=1 Tax=Portunus trituberculatus TaxID=210409 RepID=A0A5B7E0V2_PORTR|nr:hypothetical protein [Portunus trituberculatus]
MLHSIIIRYCNELFTTEIPHIEEDQKLGYAYGNVKTHKRGNPLRRIISQTPAVTYKLAKHLNARTPCTSTSLGFCLNDKSDCQEKYRRSVINAFVKRALTHSSIWKATNAELRGVSQLLTSNGYPQKDIDEVIRRRMDAFMSEHKLKTEEPSITLYYKNTMSTAYREDEKAIKKIIGSVTSTSGRHTVQPCHILQVTQDRQLHEKQLFASSEPLAVSKRRVPQNALLVIIVTYIQGTSTSQLLPCQKGSTLISKMAQYAATTSASTASC